MKNAVMDALLEFSKQDEEFARAIVEGGSFKDCMAAVAKMQAELDREVAENNKLEKQQAGETTGRHQGEG